MNGKRHDIGNHVNMSIICRPMTHSQFFSARPLRLRASAVRVKLEKICGEMYA